MRFNNDATQSVMERLNAADTSIEGASVERGETAGQAADSIQSIENRNFYETKEEKCQLVRDCFKIDKNNESLNADKKLNEVVIKLFVDNFGVLATHLSQ